MVPNMTEQNWDASIQYILFTVATDVNSHKEHLDELKRNANRKMYLEQE